MKISILTRSKAYFSAKIDNSLGKVPDSPFSDTIVHNYNKSVTQFKLKTTANVDILIWPKIYHELSTNNCKNKLLRELFKKKIISHIHSLSLGSPQNQKNRFVMNSVLFCLGV